MQNSTTILGIIEMRLRGISYDDCRSRYGVGNSTVNLIMSRYREKGVPLEVLRQMPGEEVEASFYPPSNIRRKSEDIMPDFEAIYTRINQEGSKANLYYMWLRYKQAHPSGYQYIQFCHYFNQYVSTHHGSQSLRMAVERVPGERVYIDWVGDQPELLVDAQTGELRKVHIFVTTVGVSSMIYAEAFPDEKLVSFDLLVIDDFGLMQLDLNKCRNLFEILESRDPGRSTMVISQFPVNAWYDLFQEHTYADACLNRLLHNSHRLEMNGKNMRDLTPLNK